MSNLPKHYDDFTRGVVVAGDSPTVVIQVGATAKYGIDFMLAYNSDITVSRTLIIQITTNGMVTVQFGKVTVPANSTISVIEELRGERSNFEPIILESGDKLEVIAESTGVIGVYVGVGIWN